MHFENPNHFDIRLLQFSQAIVSMMPQAIVSTRPAPLAKITVEWLQLLPRLSCRDTGGALRLN